MTRKAWKPCAKPGCSVLVRGGNRCAEHDAQIDRGRGTSAARGYDAQWAEFRAAFIKDHCEQCGTTDTESDWPLELHHLDGLGPNGPRGYDPTNLQTLCKPCHTRETATGAHR